MPSADRGEWDDLAEVLVVVITGILRRRVRVYAPQVSEERPDDVGCVGCVSSAFDASIGADAIAGGDPSCSVV